MGPAFHPAQVFTYWMELAIATQRNTYAKRQREQEKKSRADQKRAKRERKKESVQPATLPDEQPTPEPVSSVREPSP